MTVLGCKWHPSQDNVGICAHCLRESLSKLAVYQDEEDDSIDLENFPPSMPMGVPAGSRRAQFILVQYNNEDGSHGGMPPGDNSDLFYPGVNRNALVGANQHHLQPYMPSELHEPTDLHLDTTYHEQEVGTAEDSGSGGHDEAMGHHHHHNNMPPPPLEAGESGRHKRKLHSSGSGRRKPRGWGAAMMKMIGFRSSTSKKPEASSSAAKGPDQGFEDSDDFAVPTHDQQFTPPRFSVEQTTPARYSVSSQWEQQQTTTSSRYSAAAPAPEQVTPARYSGASLFDIESMDSRRFSTSSRGSPFTGKKHGENFNAPWRAPKPAAQFGKAGMRTYGDESAGQYAGKSPKKSPWKWFSSFKAVTPKEDRWSQKKVAVEAAPVAVEPAYQERRKSTSSLYAPKAPPQQPLTPVLTSKKSPWWRSSPRPRTPKPLKSPVLVAAKPVLDPELATDSDLMEDTPHRRSSASPMVGYSRSSSNGSSCFTTPRWNNRQRPQPGGTRGLAAHEITHLAI